MNRCFKEPVVEAVRGGKAGGGAQLTQTGRRALVLYEQMEGTCRQATKPAWQQLKALLK
jgi:molybdate transport system regulatory protein